MNHLTNLRKILVASVIIMVILTYRNLIGLPMSLVGSSPDTTLVSIAMIIDLICSIPGILFLQRFNVPYAAPLTFLAMITSYWIYPHILLALLPPDSDDRDFTWTVMIYCVSYLLFLACYLASYALFNLWRASAKYKYGASVLLIVAAYFATRMPS